MSRRARRKPTHPKRHPQAAPAPEPRRPPGPATLVVLTAYVVVPLAIAVALVARGGDERPPAAVAGSSSPSGLPGLQTGEAPWVAEQEHLPRRLAAVGIPFSNMEGTAVHVHPSLAVFVDGESVEVPRDIGISYAKQAMAALHTHDAEGTIHVESPTVRDYTLGQFFDTWGVRLTEDCVGAYCSGGGKRLQLFVDGKRFAVDPRNAKLIDGQRLVVAFGTRSAIEQAVR